MSHYCPVSVLCRTIQAHSLMSHHHPATDTHATHSLVSHHRPATDTHATHSLVRFVNPWNTFSPMSLNLLPSSVLQYKNILVLHFVPEGSSYSVLSDPRSRNVYGCKSDIWFRSKFLHKVKCKVQFSIQRKLTFLSISYCGWMPCRRLKLFDLIEGFWEQSNWQVK